MTTNIITATLTAYCSCKAVCTKGTGITANGQRPIQGITIAASRSVPFGSKVIVSPTLLPTGWKINNQTGYSFTVQDRLAKRYDSRFDVYFKRHEDARNFGIRKGQKVVVIIP